MRPSPTLARLKIRPRREQSPFGPFTSRRVRFSPNEEKPRSLSRQWNFDHLVQHRVPPTVKGSSSRLPAGTERIREFVHFDDRIKFWNITAGDRVIVADGPPEERGKIRHVAWTDRTRNHIGLFEEDCRAIEHRRSWFRSAFDPTSEYKKYEYTTVRLMKPGSDHIYYEDLREADMISGPSPRERGRKKVAWTRTGVAHSLHQKGALTGEREPIPWPPVPKWDIKHDAAEDIDQDIEEYHEHCRRVAPTPEQEQELQARFEAMTPEERTEWEDRERRLALVRKRQPYGASMPRSRTTTFAYRYSHEKLAWQRTFTSEPYLSPELLWLSQDPSIRSRFPELFFRDPSPSSNPDPDRTPLDRALLVPSHVPELAIQPFELTAGWHTARGKLKLFEARMRDLARSKVASEVSSLVASAENSGQAVADKEKERLTHLVSRLHRFESRLRPLTQGLKGAELRAERRRRRALMAEARHVVGNLRHKYQVQKMRAALDLLPALERYNTDLRRGELESTLRASVKVPADGGESTVAAPSP